MLTEERKAELEKQRLEAHKKAKRNHFEYWNNLPKIETRNDIPPLPRMDNNRELWETFYVVKLIEAGAIPKKDLEDGKYYVGRCRNASVARWDEEQNEFVYARQKFNYVFPETINHFEDDDFFDLFVPIKEATEEQIKNNKV